MKTVVKICGITRTEDALAAVEAGADLIGFVFAPSPRRIEPEEAGRIAKALPEGIGRVGVFVDESPDRIREIARVAGLTMIQLHGSEPEGMENCLGLPVLRAIRIRDLATGMALARRASTATLLVEPRVAGHAGGTGMTLDLGLARDMVAGLPDKNVFLAGGLGPTNVAEAIAAVRPYGVDASSRLEVVPGLKSPELMRRFVEAVSEGMGRT